MKTLFNRCKINIPVRMRNPWFWVCLCGIALTAMGVSADTFTSWGLVWEALVSLFSNPFRLGCVALAILGVFIDPTTAGIGDSSRALSYTNPNKE